MSLGAQSFDGATLAALGRIHSAQETRVAAQELHAAGIENFNLDLMYALPGQDVDRLATWRRHSRSSPLISPTTS